MNNPPTTIAIIGCGNIAGPYTQDIARHPHLRLKGVTDIDLARAQALADKAGCAVYPSVEALLADPEVSIVVNLTIFEAHFEVSRRALEAGKHVYSEKPLALNVADAQALVALARERGLRLGCSPFVHLGEAQQTAWKLIRDGKLGQVRVAYAEVNHGRIETWHPNPVPFYAVGPLWDVGVYPLTLLTTMLGPARSVTAAGRVVMPDRVTKDGTPYRVTTPDFVIAAIEHASGAISRLTASFYVSHRSSRQKSGLEFHGDVGSLALESWAAFDSPVVAGNFGEELKPVDLIAPTVGGTPWGTGISEMAQAIAENRPQRVTGDQAAHIVEILEAISTSIRTERPVAVFSGFPTPVPMPWAV
jgi:predicted dehydrogenase